jgi:hypothetical protein
MERGRQSYREDPDVRDPSDGALLEPQPSLAEELAAIPYEPLLPAEKWLIGVSLFLGVTLLAILSWAAPTFFPAAPSSASPASRAVGSQPKAPSTSR